MPAPLDEEGRSPPGGDCPDFRVGENGTVPFDQGPFDQGGREDAGRRTKGAAPPAPKPGQLAAAAKRGRLDCEIHQGVPTLQGKARAHYASGQSGGLMLIVERRAGERIRINATTEVVILEVSQEHVTVAVETSPADEEAGMDLRNGTQ